MKKIAALVLAFVICAGGIAVAKIGLDLSMTTGSGTAVVGPPVVSDTRVTTGADKRVTTGGDTRVTT